MELTKVTFTLNGIERTLSVGDAFGQLKPAETLLETLRERFGLTGAKLSCNDGACGCCTVLVDDVAVPPARCSPWKWTAKRSRPSRA